MTRILCGAAVMLEATTTAATTTVIGTVTMTGTAEATKVAITKMVCPAVLILRHARISASAAIRLERLAKKAMANGGKRRSMISTSVRISSTTMESCAATGNSEFGMR